MTTSPTPAERIAALKAKAAEKVQSERTRGEVTIENNEIVIKVNGARGSFEQRLAHVKRLNVRKYDGDRKAWIAPFSQAAQVQSLIEKAILVVDEAVRIELAGIITEQASLAAESAAGSAEEFILNFELPEGLALFPYQKAGVRYAVKQRRLIIGDEMGLGKTIMAAAAAMHEGIERIVVVCPAVVHQKWQDEITRFFPKVNVLGVGSRTATPIHLDKGFVVVGQDVLKDWVEALIDWAPGALVLDESHSYKDAKTLRSKAAMTVAGAIPMSGLVLLLTGTAIQNRPAELIQQLRIIGRLQEIAGSAKNFLYRYADGTPTGLGTHDQHLALLDALRATCYLRRNQKDVAPELPDIFRTELRVSDNLVALKVYKDAEENLVKWIAENLDEDEVEARIKAHMRNEAITRMTYLRKLAALVKLPAIAEWAQDFATEKPLVIFAHHKEVIDGLVKVLGCPKIDGGVTAVNRSKVVREFQAGLHQVIVVSTRAGGMGIDLFRADTVLFVEADWSPGAWQQAEFRVKRHGQTADKVMSIFARTHADTIDSYMAEVVARKWAAVEGVNSGRDEAMFDDPEDSTVDSVAEWLLGR